MKLYLLTPSPGKEKKKGNKPCQQLIHRRRLSEAFRRKKQREGQGEMGLLGVSSIPALLEGHPLVLSEVSSRADVHWGLSGLQLVKQARRTVTQSSFPISWADGGGLDWLVSSPMGEIEGLEDPHGLQAGLGCGLVSTLRSFPSKRTFRRWAVHPSGKKT